jgi:peptidoglycan hydrolase-like protein with peptidoglycan-binding domain
MAAIERGLSPAILLSWREGRVRQSKGFMKHILFALLGALFLFAVSPQRPALAQSSAEVVWIQIEAQPSLNAATEAARDYAGRLEDVNGFSLGGGWYAIALGPYRRNDAELVLRSYRRDRLIPRDSYLQPTSRFRSQFWPVGANVLGQGVTTAPEAPAATETQAERATEAETETEAEVTATPEPAEESPAEARRGERNLSAEERRALQVALQWAGFYEAAIDGAFGRGTRAAMADWQGANGYEVTGVLTTRQRAALFAQYNAVLEGLAMAEVTDSRAGIALQMPTAEVAFARVEPPFVHYDSRGETGARVLLISQAGDQNTLFGLYDILQTLEIVPLEGPRERRSDGFTLVGRNAEIVSETRVSLRDGQIKGFTLIWPAGDEERRTRVLEEMQASFTRLPGVLDPAAGEGGEQAIDLVAGLQVRQPRLSRSGFFIDARGTVATVSEVVEGCTRLTLDGETEAELLARSPAGLALLRPLADLAPLAVARFAEARPRLQSEVSVAGYSYEGVLSAATLTFGTLDDVRGLQGETELSRLSLAARPGDTGGPVFDAEGGVIGLLLPRPAGDQVLPEEVRFALDTQAIAALARENGLALSTADRATPMAPRDLRIAAQGMTVLVSCWD